MSAKCDDLGRSLLNESERKEEKERLSSEIYSLNNQIKDLKSDYENSQELGDYEEMESLFSEICTLEEEREDLKKSLSEFKETKFY